MDNVDLIFNKLQEIDIPVNRENDSNDKIKVMYDYLNNMFTDNLDLIIEILMIKKSTKVSFRKFKII